MATDKNIPSFNAADIEKYHQGLLSAAERHALEKAALEDPFLAEAMEGYALAKTDIAADLSDLQQRLEKRTEAARIVPLQPARKLFGPMLRVAAMIVIILGAGILVYQFAFKNKNQELAQSKQEPSNKEGISTFSADSSAPIVQPESLNKADAEKDKSAVATTGGAGNGNNPASTPVQTEDLINPPAGTLKTEEAAKPDVKPVTTDAKTTTGPPVASTTERTRSATADDITTIKDNTDKEGRQATNQPNPAPARKMADSDRMKKDQAGILEKLRNNRDQTAEEQPGSGYYNASAMNTFRGRVTDASNSGLPFANVTNLRDNVGTYTDANGNFVLTSPDSVMTVQIRSLGFDNNNVQLRNDVAANKIVMQENNQNLSEVVISKQKPNASNRAIQDKPTLIEPEPVDGWVKYDSYLANNLNVPDEFIQKRANDVSTVELSFEVDKNGEPVNIRIEKSLCKSCDSEAIRLIKDGPKWKRSASKKGRTRVTINF